MARSRVSHSGSGSGFFKWLFFLFLVALVSLSGAPPVFAAVITVTNTNPNGAGSLWQAVLDAASGDTIDATWISGTITPSDEITIDKDLTIKGSGIDALRVSGGGTHRVLTILSGNTGISDLTISDGYVDGAVGAGIYIQGGSLSLTRCRIENHINNEGTSGGGIYHQGTRLTLDHCEVTGNLVRSSSSSAIGGGIALESNAGLTVVDSTFTQNRVTGTYEFGGALYSAYGGTVVARNTTFSGNQAENGGAIYIGADGSSTDIENSIIRANTGAGGGGIYVYSGTLTITDSTIADNNTGGTAGFQGGGLYLRSVTSPIHIENSTINGNQAEYGGGLYIHGAGAVTELNNSTISGNTATHGGGIYNLSGTVTVDNTTIGQNDADQGGGINNGTGSVTLKNAILAGNTGNSAPDCQGDLLSGGWNLVGDETGCSFAAGSGDVTNRDARLGILQNNGGSTNTHELLPGSPAIDSADPDDFPATDQRGISRPRDGRANGTPAPDMGAFELRAYGLTAARSGAGDGTVESSPAGIDCGDTCANGFRQNSVVNLTVSPDAVSTFEGWSGDCSGTDACQLNMDGPKNVAARFSLNTYTIDARVNDAAGGTIDPAGPVPVAGGRDQKFTITPHDGYHIQDVEVDSSSIGPVGQYTFQNVTSDHVIEAEFVKDPPSVHTITAAAGSGGSIDPEGQVSVNDGEDRVFDIRPDDDHRISDVIVDGGSVGAVSTFTFHDVRTDHGITAEFEPKPRTITASAGTGGIISPSGQVGVPYGGEQAFSIDPDTGYQIDAVLVDDVFVGDVHTYTFTNVTRDHTIEARFKANPPATHVINATAGTGGHISPQGNVSVTDGADQAFTITPDLGFAIRDVRVDGASVGTPSRYTFTQVHEKHTIVAEFTPDPHTIQAAAQTGGTISPAGNVAVAHGADQAFTISPDAGYAIDDVLVDGLSRGKRHQYTFRNVTRDHTIEARFAVSPPATHSINALAGQGGTITPSGNVTVTDGRDQNFTITADQGYDISDVLVDGLSQGPVSQYHFLNVIVNHTIEARFVREQLTITASAGRGGGISPHGLLKVDYGVDRSFTVSAAQGYDIGDVRVDGNSVGAVSSYTFLRVRTDHSIRASFDPKTYVITATKQGSGTISPRGSVPVRYGEDRTFAITPESGYKISDLRVDGASIEPVDRYTFENVTGNHTIEAVFVENPPPSHTINASAEPGGLINPSGNVDVTDEEDQTFAISPDPDHHITDVVVDGRSLGPQTAYTFTKVTANHTINARFDPNPHNITASAGTGGAISPAGQVKVNDGADRSFIITPDSGYHIEDVRVDGRGVGPVHYYAFTRVHGDHAIEAAFAPDQPARYTINAVAGEGGHIAPAGNVIVEEDRNQTFTIYPDNGYRVQDVLVDGISIGPVTSYTFQLVDANHAIRAFFTVSSHSIAASASAGGYIEPFGVTTVQTGGYREYTMTPLSGYHLDDVRVDDLFVGAVATYTFWNVVRDHAIWAKFAPDPLTVTASAGTGGDIIPSGDITVAYGDDQSFTVMPGGGYRIDDLIVDGESKGAVHHYSFHHVTQNHDIRASFRENPIQTYSINAGAGEGGSILPQGNVLVTAGAGQTFNIAPDPEHRIADVLVDSVSVGAVSSYTFGNVRANHTIRAEFSPDPLFIAATTGPNGIISPSGEVPVPYGKEQSFFITPDQGYNIEDVLVDGLSVGEVHHYTFRQVTRDHTIWAGFSSNPTVEFVINAVSGPGGSMTPYGDVQVIEGDDQSFSITPDQGYQITEVLVDGQSQGAGPDYVFQNVTANHTIRAAFDPLNHAVTASAGNGGVIDPSGRVLVAHEADQAFTITPEEGYRIDDVTVDGHSVGPVHQYTFQKVSQNHEIIAAFTSIPSTEVVISAQAEEGGDISPRGNITLEKGTDQTFTVTPHPDYDIADVVVDTQSQGPVDTYTFVDLTANHNIRAVFSHAAPVITAAAGEGGHISPQGAVQVAYDGNQTFTITPDGNRKIFDVVVDGISQGPVSSYIFTRVVADHTIEVSFTGKGTWKTSHGSGGCFIGAGEP